MRRLITLAALVAFLMPALVGAQGTTTPVARYAILASNFDLDGEAADPDQVVVSVLLADSTSYTIAAQPDVCRLIDITITDANSSVVAGLLTVTGTDCWDRPLKATYTFAGGGSGVKTLTVIDFDTANPKIASGAYFKTITAVSNGALTGEDGIADAITVGYTNNSQLGYPLYGKYVSSPSGRRRVDPFDSYEVKQLVKNGAATTDVIAVSASTTAPFEGVAVGDLVIFNISGEIIVRKVATKADNDTITVNAGVTIPSAGVNFYYKRFFFSTDPQDGWFPVLGWDTVSVAFEVDANVSTGGVTSSIECATFITSDPPNSEVEVQVDTANVGTGATGEDVTTVDLRLTPHYTHCRAGIKFGTGDDADAANEDIDLVLGLRR